MPAVIGLDLTGEGWLCGVSSTIALFVWELDRDNKEQVLVQL